MSNFKRNANLQALRDAEPRYYDYLDGVTGKLDANGVPLSNASVGLEPGWTWVQLQGQREGAAVLNSAVNPNSPGIPVETAINRRTGKREVVRGDWEEAVRIFGYDTARRVLSPDPTAVESDTLTMGKVDPAADLTIYVRRFVHDLTEFPGAYYDLSSIVGGMTADTQEMVLIGVDETTNAVTVTEGDEQSLAYTFQQADADAITLATSVLPLWGLVLRADQTDSTDSFVPYKRLFDRRQFLNIASGAGYVLLSPASSTRNVIQPTGDFIGLVLKNSASQTVNLFEQQDSGGAALAFLSAAGALTATALNAYSTVGGTLMNVVGDGGAANGLFQSYNAAAPATSTQFTMSRARGSLASPAVIQTNDRMGQILFQGWDGDQFINAVTILASVSGVVANDSVPARLIFNLLSLAGDTALTEYLRFQGGVIVFNEGGADLDVRLEGDTNANLFFTDASADAIGIGTNAPATMLHVLLADSGTNSVANVLTLGHNGGSVAAGFGGGIALQLESSTTNAQDAAAIEWRWQTATHASRSADLVLSAYNTTNKREGLRIRGGGAGAELGFFGTTPAARQTGYTTFANLTTDRTLDANATTLDEVADVLGTLIVDLKTLGIIAA